MSRLYLRDTSVGLSAYANAEKSVAKPSGALSNAGSTWNMLEEKGAAQTLIFNGSSNPTTTHQDAWMGRFISEPIGVSQVNANTWTIAVAVAEANANGNAFLSITLYVLKNDDTVRGFIYDTDTALGTEFATNENGRVVTIAGAAVTGCVSTDRIVCEIWWHTTAQGMGTSYTRSLWVNGTIDPADGVAISNAASYIETPQTIFSFPPTVNLNTADASTFTTATLALVFVGTDINVDDIEYEIQIDPLNTFDTRPKQLYSESNYSFDNNLGPSANKSVGQAFTNSVSTPLISATFYLKKTGAPTGTAVAKIYAATGTVGTNAVATGAALAISDVFDVSKLSTVYQLIEFIFSGVNIITLAQNTGYVIAIESTTDNYVDVGQDNSSPTHPGNSVIQFHALTWSYNALIDCIFYINGGTGALLDKVSDIAAGFLDISNGADTHPFASGDQIGYTVQAADALSNGTYYWRVRGRDPLDSKIYGVWSTIRSFDVSVSASVESGKFFAVL